MCELAVCVAVLQCVLQCAIVCVYVYIHVYVYTEHRRRQRMCKLAECIATFLVLPCVVMCLYIFICMCIRNTGVDKGCANWQAASGSYTLRVDDKTDGLFAIMLYRTSLSSLHYLDGQKVCCSVLQRVAACYSMLQRVAACWRETTKKTYGLLSCCRTSLSLLHYFDGRKVCCIVLQCVAVRCSVLQCVAVCCSVLQCRDVRRTNRRTVCYDIT